MTFAVNIKLNFHNTLLLLFLARHATISGYLKNTSLAIGSCLLVALRITK